jgi:hypothetical protein
VTATDPQDYLFFDGVHPTSKAHQLAGLEAAAGMNDALGIHQLVVTSTADTVDPTASGLSLRELVNLSNAMNGQQTITFDLGAGPHQITLSGKSLPITQGLAVDGPADRSLTISGGGKSRAFDVAAGTDVTLSDLTIAHGTADQGGAIANAGHLSVKQVAFLSNTAQVGGAVYNTGWLSMEGSLLAYNSAVGGSVAAGGALANAGPSAAATLWSTVVIDNTAQGTFARGSGIANLAGGELSIAYSVIAGNRAEGLEAWGGGIFNDTGSTLDLSFTLVTANSADADGGAGGHGLGGGVYLASGSRTGIHSSTIVGNFASTGGRNVYQAR